MGNSSFLIRYNRGLGSGLDAGARGGQGVGRVQRDEPSSSQLG